MEPAIIAVSRFGFYWLWIYTLGSFQVTSFVLNFYCHFVLSCDNLKPNYTIITILKNTTRLPCLSLLELLKK